jgi:hypothetical protein
MVDLFNDVILICLFAGERSGVTRTVALPISQLDLSGLRLDGISASSVITSVTYVYAHAKPLAPFRRSMPWSPVLRSCSSVL